MKPVNLLPATERPRAVAAAPKGASTGVLVALGVLLLAVGIYVLGSNQITDRKAAIASATQEKQEAEQEAQRLQAFGDFRTIKQTRMNSISELASKRFDWERLMRELALVLPDKVWVTEVTGGSAATAGTSGSTPAAPATPPSSGAASATGTAATSSGGQSVKITGCAPSQKAVAETMVRLGNLGGAEDVQLQDSAAPEKGSGTGDGAAPATGGSSEEGCGSRYQFNATVTFAAQDPSGGKKPARLPSRLGGGA